MNYNLPLLPFRPQQPREMGLTMMMDKGLSLRQCEDFVASSSEFCDIIKLGFGTSLITKNLKEKLAIYNDAGLKTYFGGTLFEAFVVRGMFDEYRRYLDTFNMGFAEISDGTVTMPHDEKLEYIRQLSKQVTVLSEVGSKVADKVIPDADWIKMMAHELEAGSWKVIAEARETGTVGIFNSNGSANVSLIDKIEHCIDKDKIIWEAPQKSQQVWFIKHIGHNVNLGNISYDEVIPLETLRLGLRGDTLLSSLPEEINSKYN